MSTTIIYNNETIATATNQSKLLKTAGTYMEGDVLVTDSTPTYNTQAKTGINPSTSSQTITPDSGYDALSSVQINAMPVGSAKGPASVSASGATVITGTNTLTLHKQYVDTTPTVTAGYVSSATQSTGTVQVTASVPTNSSSDLTVSGATVTAPSGYYKNSASASVASGTAGTPTATKGTVGNHSVSVTPSVTNTTGYITGSTIRGTAVTVSASELVSGTKSISANGTGIDVTNYASVDVAVPSEEPSLQAKTNIAPSTSSQTITADTGYDGLSSVQINAMPSGTAGTPVATKGTVSNNSVTVTPSVTNTTGYITGSTKTGTAVTVSASELVSGSETKTENGTYDVTNLASVVIDVPTGGLYQEKTVTPSYDTQIIEPDDAGVTNIVDVGRVDITGISGSSWSYTFPISWSESPVVGDTYHLSYSFTRSTSDDDYTYTYNQDIVWNGYGTEYAPNTVVYLSFNSDSTATVRSTRSSAYTPYFSYIIITKSHPKYDALSKVTVLGIETEKKQINFIDYDGRILHSYTKSEWQSSGVLPSNPSHTGLTAQGWNWTKAQIDAQLTADPYSDIWIGQMYITTSGDTEIDVSMHEGRLDPILTIAVNGTITVDWGDNTTPDTVTGSSLTTRQAVSHTYAASGDYTMVIHVVSGSFQFYGSDSYTLLRKNTTTNENRVYANCVKAVRFGSGVTSINDSAFYDCSSLTSITIPSSVTSIGPFSGAFYNCISLRSITIPSRVTSIGASAFYNCRSLTSITIPSIVTSIGASAFYNCSSLATITIPSSVTSIGASAFYNCWSLTLITIPNGITTIYSNTFYSCYSLASITIPQNVTSMESYAFERIYGMAELHVLPTTPPTNNGAIGFAPADCKIYVPAASLSDYQAATNWSNYASYMVGE